MDEAYNLMRTVPTVWMYGGGTQSAAIAALIIQKRIPRPDFAVIADTGREKQSTWDYLENVVQPALPFTIHRISKDNFATVDLYRNEDLLIPAYTNQSGSNAKLPTFCSNEWKERPCERWLRTKMRVRKFIKWIGFSVDEVRRWKKMRDSQGDEVYFPLVDGIEMTRAGCIALVESMGWPTPPRSSCWMCPNMRDEEWMALNESEFEQAVKFDRKIREIDPNVFLHKSCKPLDQVRLQPSLDEPRPCDSGNCFL